MQAGCLSAWACHTPYVEVGCSNISSGMARCKVNHTDVKEFLFYPFLTKFMHRGNRQQSSGLQNDPFKKLFGLKSSIIIETLGLRAKDKV